MSKMEQELIDARATVVGMASASQAAYDQGGDYLRNYIERLQTAANEVMRLMEQRMNELNEQMRKP